MDTERCIVLFVQEIVFLEQDPAAKFHSAAPSARGTDKVNGVEGGCLVSNEPWCSVVMVGAGLEFSSRRTD